METAAALDPVRLWVVTDGRAGNEAQALGLAEAIARARPAEIEVKRIALKSWAARVPAGASHMLRHVSGDWPFSGLVDGGAGLQPPWPACVIGAGRRSAPIVAALRERHAMKAVQLLAPQMPNAAFDAVIAPKHDGLEGANVLTSIGALNRITPEKIREVARQWDHVFGEPGLPGLAVLIGGPSGSAEFGDEDAVRLCIALETLAEEHTLRITASRRTPETLSARLTQSLGPSAYLWRPEDGGDNPYPGLLGHAEAVLVTEDSVNMASEAASSGLPVHVFPVGRVGRKIRQFHAELEKYGASRRFKGALSQWDYTPLAEADRIAGELIRRGVI